MQNKKYENNARVIGYVHILLHIYMLTSLMYTVENKNMTFIDFFMDNNK